MTRYYFDLSDGTRERDDTGIEFPDVRAAQREGIQYAGKVLKHDPGRLEQGHMRVDIRDEQGALCAIDVRLVGRPGEEGSAVPS